MGTKSSCRNGGTEFQREWSRQEKLFREAGMADDAIEEIRRFDLKAFRSEKDSGGISAAFSVFLMKTGERKKTIRSLKGI